MSENNEPPFSEVLESLFTKEDLPIHLLYYLSDLTSDNLNKFLERWPDVPDERRRIIIRHLADISEENYLVDFLSVFSTCLNDASPLVRIAALDGIWDATNLALIEPIVLLLQTDESDEVRSAAASSLAHYILLAEWGQLPLAILPTILEPLFEEYEKPGISSSLRCAILEALSPANDSRISNLIEDAYENGDTDLQLSAVFAMGGSADPRWLPIVIDEMASISVEMRAEAARAAGSIGDDSALSELINLIYDEDNDVIFAAVSALGQVGGEQAARFLVELADDPDFEEFHEAVDDALEEMEWMNGTFDFFSLTDDEEIE